VNPLSRLAAIAAAVLISALALNLAATSLSRADEAPVVVASKIDTEGALLGQMIAAAIEAKGLPVTRKIQLGPTNIVRGAILAGQIDIYPEYTGNGAVFFHRDGDPVWKNAGQGYADRQAARQGAEPSYLAQPGAGRQHLGDRDPQGSAGFSRQEMPRRAGAYLKGGGKFKLAASAEFVSSPAALPAFEQTYGFHLSADQILTLSGGNTATTLRAAAEGISGVNAAMAYGTDGELAALGLTALCDDKGAQVVYAPAPVIREPVLGAHPAIGPALDPIFASLTLETLQQLNARIAVGGEQPEAVAVSYLKSKHFLP
jgi:osmoprotectant transport system substrate-binding protein